MTHVEKLAKRHEVDDYFSDILQVYICGYPEKVVELASKLKRHELVQFIVYCMENGGPYSKQIIQVLSVKNNRKK